MSNPTVAEQALQDAMRKRGCLHSTYYSFELRQHVKSLSPNCYNLFPEIHHINADGMKRKEWAIIPLCDLHHTKLKISIHANKNLFREIYAHEWLLYFKILNAVIGNLKQEHQAEIIQKIDAYAMSGHASLQFSQAYEKGREG